MPMLAPLLPIPSPMSMPVSQMDFTDVLMLKICLILAVTSTNINISASLLVIAVGSTCVLSCVNTSKEYG